jgi:type I restriction enzyme M protein
MRKDKGLNGDLDRIPMMTWIMFLKFLDDQEQIREAEAKLSRKKFQPTIDPPYRWRDWAAKHDGMTGQELIAFINQDEAIRPDGTRGLGLFAYLRSLSANEERDRRDVVASVFKGTINRMLNGYLLRDVINRIDGIHFSTAEEVHTLAFLYESVLKEMRDAAGDNGEFYTPRPVVKFMVQVTNPKLGETVLDPAAGTGGFLVEAYSHMGTQCKKAEDFETLQKGTLLGFEAKPMPFLLCQMNMVLHGIEAPDVDPGNSLRFPLREIGEKDRVDVILTNPPFGGEEERGILGNFPEDKRVAETALLFLQLIMRKLHRLPRMGRAAVVVPDGTLSGGGVSARVKEELLKEFNLHTIVRLPPGVFAPYTPIPTNLLFFDTSRPTQEIWYYELPLPEGRKNYTMTEPLRYEEFAECLKWWTNRKSGDHSFMVRASDVLKHDSDGVLISADLDIKNPKKRNDLKLVSTDELLSKLLQNEKSITDIIQQMKDSLLDTDGKLFEVSDLKPFRVHIADADVVLNRETRDPKRADPEGEFAYVDISSVKPGPSVITKKQARILPTSQAPSRARRVVRENDVIFSTVRPNLRAVAKVGEGLDNQICSTGFAVFTCGASIDPDFLLYQLCSPFIIDQCVARTTGAHYPAINESNLRQVVITVPPLPEQRRIVSYLKKRVEELEKKVIELKSLQAENAAKVDNLLPTLLDAPFRR